MTSEMNLVEKFQYNLFMMNTHGYEVFYNEANIYPRAEYLSWPNIPRQRHEEPDGGTWMYTWYLNVKLLT